MNKYKHMYVYLYIYMDVRAVGECVRSRRRAEEEEVWKCREQEKRRGCERNRGREVDVLNTGEEVWMCWEQMQRCGCVRNR